MTGAHIQTHAAPSATALTRCSRWMCAHIGGRRKPYSVPHLLRVSSLALAFLGTVHTVPYNDDHLEENDGIHLTTCFMWLTSNLVSPPGVMITRASSSHKESMTAFSRDSKTKPDGSNRSVLRCKLFAPTSHNLDKKQVTPRKDNLYLVQHGFVMALYHSNDVPEVK